MYSCSNWDRFIICSNIYFCLFFISYESQITDILFRCLDCEVVSTCFKHKHFLVEISIINRFHCRQGFYFGSCPLLSKDEISKKNRIFSYLKKWHISVSQRTRHDDTSVLCESCYENVTIPTPTCQNQTARDTGRFFLLSF